jgi:hypothetical protein
MSRRWWIVAGILGMCLGLERSRTAETPKRADEARWLSEWEEGRKAARRSGKPIFVVFRCEN